jgi:hypothetical protein
MQIALIFFLCSITAFSGDLDATDIVKLDTEQKNLESHLVYTSEQLLFLRKLSSHEKISFERNKDLQSFKGKKLLNFIAKYGFPNNTFVRHNLRPVKGGSVTWHYLIEKNVVFELNLMQSENNILIKNCYFFDLNNPRKTIVIPQR